MDPELVNTSGGEKKQKQKKELKSWEVSVCVCPSWGLDLPLGLWGDFKKDLDLPGLV